MINYNVQGYMQMMQKHIDVCENDKYQNQESSYF